MTYYLLTGASGLLGSYLLRDCLVAGYRMAVLVRPTERQSARERVNERLAYWEEQTGRNLPRPMVLEGDLCRPDLNLTASDLRWVADCCHAVIHSAARLQRDACLCLAQAEALLFREETFDAVFSVGGFNFFTDKHAAMKEMIRVAKPGATILVWDGRFYTLSFVKPSPTPSPTR